MGCMFEQYDIQEYGAVSPRNTSKMFLNVSLVAEQLLYFFKVLDYLKYFLCPSRKT